MNALRPIRPEIPTRTRRTLALLAIAAMATALPAPAADHLDAPGLTPPGGDGRLDINDVYAFQAPGNPGNAVLIMTVNPAAGLLSPTDLAPGVQYAFHIDQDGDAKSDLNLRLSAGDVAGGSQDLRLRCTPARNCPAGANLATGRTGDVIPVATGGSLLVDTFDDPFFFDLDAFLGTNGRTFCDGGENDFFLGLNVTAIVLEVPRSVLGDGTVGVWATTSSADEGQVDRMGRPAINTVFIPNNPFEPSGSEASQKNFFNAGKPRNDVRDFRGEIVDTLEIFYGAGDPTIDVLTGILLPDILTVDFADPSGFLNGRRLADDVIDAELALVTNGIVPSDCVDNDSAFVDAFPYLAPLN